MVQIQDGTYWVDVTNRRLIRKNDLADFSEYVTNWDAFIQCGFDDIFDHGIINVISDDSIVICRIPTISYFNMAKFKISDVFDILMLSEGGSTNEGVCQ